MLRRPARRALRAPVELFDAGGERLGAFRFHQQTVRGHFGNRAGARRHDGFSGSHGFQQHDAESFLHARQAENVATVEFGGQFGAGHIAEKGNGASEAQVFRKAAQGRAARARAHDANGEPGNALAQRGRGMEQQVDALAAVKSADEEHREALTAGAGSAPGSPPSSRAPLGQIDQLRHHHRRLLSP